MVVINTADATYWYVRMCTYWLRVQVQLGQKHLCLRIIIVIYNWSARLDTVDILGSGMVNNLSVYQRVTHF